MAVWLGSVQRETAPVDVLDQLVELSAILLKTARTSTLAAGIVKARRLPLPVAVM